MFQFFKKFFGTQKTKDEVKAKPLPQTPADVIRPATTAHPFSKSSVSFRPEPPPALCPEVIKQCQRIAIRILNDRMAHFTTTTIERTWTVDDSGKAAGEYRNYTSVTAPHWRLVLLRPVANVHSWTVVSPNGIARRLERPDCKEIEYAWARAEERYIATTGKRQRPCVREEDNEFLDRAEDLKD